MFQVPGGASINSPKSVTHLANGLGGREYGL